MMIGNDFFIIKENLVFNFKNMIVKDWIMYYTLEEAIEISDKNIEKSAELLIQDLRNMKKELISKEQVYV